MAYQDERLKKIDKAISEGGAELSLDWKKINDQGIQYIATKQLGDVTTVNLIGNEITCKAIGFFKEIRMNSLEQLYVNFNNIGSKGCKLLTQGRWPRLRVLALESCNIENAGIAHLSKGEWKALQSLNLNENIISRDGLKNLLKLYTPTLRSLELSYNPFPISFAVILSQLRVDIQDISLRNHQKMKADTLSNNWMRPLPQRLFCWVDFNFKSQQFDCFFNSKPHFYTIIIIILAIVMKDRTQQKFQHPIRDFVLKIISTTNTLNNLTIPAMLILPFLGGFYGVYRVRKWKIHRPSLIQNAMIYALSFTLMFGASIYAGLFIGLASSWLFYGIGSTLENTIKQKI